jgi:hypothetical protein
MMHHHKLIIDQTRTKWLDISAYRLTRQLLTDFWPGAIGKRIVSKKSVDGELCGEGIGLNDLKLNTECVPVWWWRWMVLFFSSERDGERDWDMGVLLELWKRDILDDDETIKDVSTQGLRNLQQKFTFCCLWGFLNPSSLKKNETSDSRISQRENWCTEVIALNTSGKSKVDLIFLRLSLSCLLPIK